MSVGILLGSAHFIVDSATDLARILDISPILVGLIVIGVGTTIPEMSFAMQAVKKYHDSLAVGDILGSVLADATIVIGTLCLIQPFAFPIQMIYVTGVCMFLASILLCYFMRSGKVLTKKEGILLILFWLLFVTLEYTLNS